MDARSEMTKYTVDAKRIISTVVLSRSAMLFAVRKKSFNPMTYTREVS